LLGSPGYMSPEQVRNTKGVDARTDVWSTGVILFELLTGKEAYTGESLGDVFAKIREEPLPPIGTIRPEVPAGLEAVIAKCLERDREKRFADGAELRDALLPFTSETARGPLQSVASEELPPALGVLPPEEKATVRIGAPLHDANTISTTSAKTVAVSL